MVTWAAPHAGGPIDAVVELPGSKSATNRALVLAALADGTSVVRRPLRSRDTGLMVGGLRALGIAIQDVDGDWHVSGRPDALDTAANAVDVGNAGTVARFLPPVATLAKGDVRFDGDPRIRERPIGPLLAALRTLGADIDDTAGALPLVVHGRGELPGGDVTIDASESSQLVSGLLLVGARATRGVTVVHDGAEVPSRPHIAMTVEMLRDAGASVDDSAPNAWHVAAGSLRAHDIDVEPDLATAAPYVSAALATGGTVRVEHWPQRSNQPGAALPALLTAMGAHVERDESGLVFVGGTRVTGIDADLRDYGELVPVLAALAALADTPSELRGIGHLRRHETDRLAALATELSKLGACVVQSDDGLAFEPARLHGGVFETYDDHRLVMAAAVIGLAVPGVEIVNAPTVAKTDPDFVARWSSMLPTGVNA